MVSVSPSSLSANVLRRLAHYRGTLIVCGLATLIPCFYFQQNWTGKRAWDKCSCDLEAKGEVLEWAAYIPQSIPDDQNIFAVPKISAWFVRAKPGPWSGPLVARLNNRASNGQNALGQPIEIARLTFETNGTHSAGAEDSADLLLAYDPPNLLAVAEGDPPPSPLPPQEIIPLIIMEDVPLADAIRALAAKAKLKYSIDPDVFPQKNGAASQPSVSIRWEDVTARAALKALLRNYDLALVSTPDPQTMRIVKQDPAKPRVFADSKTRQTINALLQQTFAPLADARKGVRLDGSQGFTFVKEPLRAFSPLHLVIKANDLPERSEIAAFFPANVISPEHADAGGFEIRRTGAGTFSVTIRPSVYEAEAYLAWSDQFEAELDTIRQAVKRPSARMDGDYKQPFQMPVQNFVAIRSVTQLTAQRAQCFLLLGEPEKALHELTLLHDLSRLLNAAPESKPTTLVAAMINVAITGVYVQAVADGLRLRAWQEPQLVALQQQLKEVDLVPGLLHSFRSERAGICHTFEVAAFAGKGGIFPGKAPNRTLWQKIKDPDYWFFIHAPRGWVYQNMVTVAMMQQKILDSFGPTSKIVRAHDLDKVFREMNQTLSHFSPKTFLAAVALPNYTRACKTAAFTQTRANQAFLVCALERYRLSHGGYPDQLTALLPAFVETLPNDLLNGQSLHYASQKDGRFILYSVGWNETDDDGVSAPAKSNMGDSDKPDWLWN